MENITVSIVCLTYNQENYIGQALESFLMQQTDFPFEIIVHDDASTDGTAAVVARYAKRHPGIVRPVFETENQYANGLLAIYDIAFRECRGKYIAYCEGDDWFSDPLKLQKQVDFMESHPDYGLVHTGFRKFRQDSGRMSPFDSTKHIPEQGDVFKKMLVHNIVVAPTALFRTDLAREAMKTLLQPSKSEKWMTPDYPLWLYIAMKSKIGYLPDVTTVYRYSKQSVSSNKKPEQYAQFLRSIRTIKEFFIRLARVGPETADRALAKSACEVYQYSVKKNLPDKAEHRAFFRQYSHALEGYAPLKFCSRHPFFEIFYR